MANQALINAAQRMYSAKAQQTDITPITDAVSSSVANITKAVQEKRAEQEERSEKAIEPFKNILLENPDARPQLQAELDKLQDQYFQNIKTSEKLFGNKDEKKQAIDDNNNISYVLRAYQKDLESVDLNMVAPSNPSEFNSIGEQVDGVGMKDVSLANRLIFKSGKDDAGKDITGIYTKNHKGEEVRLSDYKGQSQINTEGFDRLVETRQNAINVAKKGGDWESEAAPRLQKNLSELMLDKNWGSMLFDDLDGYNWATQQMEQEGVDDKEAFKIKVKENPDFYKKEYVNDVLAAYKLDFDEAKLKTEQEEKGNDEESIAKNLNSLRMQGVPVNLGTLTGELSNKYLNVQLNSEGNYTLLDNEFEARREGGDADNPVITYTPEQMAAMIGVDVSELTGKPAEATTDATAGEGTVLAPPPASGEEIVDDITPKQETSTKDKVPNSDAEAKTQVEDIKKSSKKPNWFQRQLMKFYGHDPDSPEYSWNKPNELDEVITGSASKTEVTAADYGLSEEAFAEFNKYPRAKELDKAYKEGKLKNAELIAWVKKNIQNVAT